VMLVAVLGVSGVISATREFMQALRALN
jgi:hypothetical protein